MAISKFVMILLPFEWVVKEIYHHPSVTSSGHCNAAGPVKQFECLSWMPVSTPSFIDGYLIWAI